MPVSNFLTSEQKKNLQKAIKEDTCPHFREHVLIMLLANDGKTQRQIADFIGCSLRTVNDWFNQADPDDLESFRDRRSQGNYKKVNPEYIERLDKLVEQEPSTLGYEFGRWTCQRLAEHLEKETGILLSGQQVKRILKKKDIDIFGKNIR
jgi:transposase